MRYKDNAHGLHLLGWLLIGLFLILVSFGAYFYITTVANKNEIDPNTLCEKEVNYNKHAILIDITDKYNFIQQSEIKNEIESIIKNLEKGEQLLVYFLNDNVSKDTHASLKICNPGDGSDENKFYRNPKLMKKKWKKEFYDPLKNSVGNIEKDKTFNKSPLLEMIQFINVSQFKTNNSNQNKLTIFSDMIQNSSNFSFFKNKLENFFSSRNYNTVHTKINDLEIDIFLLRRPGHENKQTKPYREFWINYFIKSGADLNRIKRLDG